MTRKTGLLMTPTNRQKSIDNLKTKTRRVIELPSWSTKDWKDFETDGAEAEIICARTGCMAVIPCPYGKKGDLLYLKEPTEVLTFQSRRWAGTELNSVRVRYPDGMIRDLEITSDDYKKLAARKNLARPTRALFMLRSFARYWFTVTDIRVEKLQDISESDAIAEGIYQMSSGYWTGGIHPVKGTYKHMPDPLSGFRDLWNSINKARGYGWDQNPWVWVVSYLRNSSDLDSL